MILKLFLAGGAGGNGFRFRHCFFVASARAIRFGPALIKTKRLTANGAIFSGFFRGMFPVFILRKIRIPAFTGSKIVLIVFDLPSVAFYSGFADVAIHSGLAAF